MRPASPEDRQRIIDLYKGGMTRPAIARETGWSEGTVSNIIKAAGVQGAGRVTGIRTPPETEAEIMALYEQGVTWREIIERTGRTEHTVSAIIKRNGGSLKRKKPLAPEDWERIVALYKQGTDAPELGREFGCHTSMIYYVLEHSGVDRREQIACDNPSYFDRIDTPDRAYWLGFIAADGCITGAKYPRLQVKLARKDRDHLVLLHKALGARRPILDNEQFSAGKMRPYSTLTVYSPPLAEALVSHGITPRKTATLQPWRGPEHLMPHYWRGLVDGDGHITINGNGVYMGLLGSKPVADAFAAWANRLIGSRVNATRKKPSPTAWCVQVGGTIRVRALLRALYDDAPVALARKKALADLAVYGKPLQASIF